MRGPATSELWDKLDLWLEDLEAAQKSSEDISRMASLLAVMGAEGAGKTRLLTEWTKAVEASGLSPVSVIDEADRREPLELFKAINEAMSTRKPLVLIGRARPATWVRDLEADGAPDLKSRLNAIQTYELDAPDAETLTTALRMALLEVGLDLPEGTIRQAASRLCRRFTAVCDIALSAARLSASIGAVKPLLTAAIADNPRHALS